jgi:molecular chaperone DnaK
MVQDAERFAEEDARLRAQVEARNAADSALYTAERTMVELADKVGQEDHDAVDAASKALKAALQQEAPVQELEKATQALLQALGRASAKLYAQGQAQQGEAPQGQPPDWQDRPEGFKADVKDERDP